MPLSLKGGIGQSSDDSHAHNAGKDGARFKSAKKKRPIKIVDKRQWNLDEQEARKTPNDDTKSEQVDRRRTRFTTMISLRVPLLLVLGPEVVLTVVPDHGSQPAV